MVSATVRICSMSSRSGERSITSLNGGAEKCPAIEGNEAPRGERRPVVRRFVAFAADKRDADADERRRRGDGVAAMMPGVRFNGGTGHRLRFAQHEAE